MKFLAFGCSFTDYAWPTWADIIARDQPTWHYENWGLGGGGNQAIARRVLYRCLAEPLAEDDIVILQWTSWCREDRFQTSRWVSEGNVVSAPYYGAEFAERYWTAENDAINTLQARHSTELALGKNLKYQMAMTPDDVMGRPTLYSSDRCGWVRSQLRACDEFEAAWPALEGLAEDGHPDPLQWMTWVETRIYPRLGLTLRPETRDSVLELQDYIMTLARQRIRHRIIQQEATKWAVKHGWDFRRHKPGSDIWHQQILY
jgi:hypothetical protein